MIFLNIYCADLFSDFSELEISLVLSNLSGRRAATAGYNITPTR